MENPQGKARSSSLSTLSRSLSLKKKLEDVLCSSKERKKERKEGRNTYEVRETSITPRSSPHTRPNPPSIEWRGFGEQLERAEIGEVTRRGEEEDRCYCSAVAIVLTMFAKLFHRASASSSEARASREGKLRGEAVSEVTDSTAIVGESEAGSPPVAVAIEVPQVRRLDDFPGRIFVPRLSERNSAAITLWTD